MHVLQSLGMKNTIQRSGTASVWMRIKLIMKLIPGAGEEVRNAQAKEGQPNGCYRQLKLENKLLFG